MAVVKTPDPTGPKPLRGKSRTRVAKQAPDVSRSVKPGIRAQLWGRAAGRCEFDGCNRPLWRSGVTQDQRNLGQLAHIRAFSARGPRAGGGGERSDVHDASNLILLCPVCHITIDTGDGPTKFPVELLRAMKVRHERRVEMATAVASDRSSHIVTYATSVGFHHALPSFADAREALFPDRYPESDTSELLIELGTPTTRQQDGTPDFWSVERAELSHRFHRQIRGPLQRGNLGHLSVFALAPQPLLIELGVLLGDITEVAVYQRHREPQTWCWPATGDTCDFQVDAPPTTDGLPALVLSVSASITLDRVSRCLGSNVSAWTVAVPNPHNDVVKARGSVAAFRATLRQVLDRIKAQHGHSTPLHIFPALPVVLAVELGRVRMPKADTPWEIYDEHQGAGGFSRAFTIDHNTGAP